MKSKRLEELYRRRLIDPKLPGKTLPLEHILKKPVTYYPQKPEEEEIDILEIGPGRGDFLFHLAKTFASKKILGIEIGNVRFQKLVQNCGEKNFKNIFLIHGDARVPIFKDLKNMRLEKVFVLFPDPWPKNKQRHKRLLQKDFLERLCEMLKPSGEFTLATDVQDYAEWTKAHFEKIPFMEQIIQKEFADLVPTFFQEKWEKLGRVKYFLRFKRRDGDL